MKKSIASALMATLLLGTASTTFATPTDEEVAELRARIAELERIIQEQNASTAKKGDVRRLDSRVSELEDKSAKPNLLDKFNITGELRYRFFALHKNEDVSNLQFRLMPTFKIDDHFTVKSRFRSTFDMKNDARAYDYEKAKTAIRTDYAYLESKFNNFQVNAGKMPLYSNADDGLVLDSDFSGLQFIFGDKTKLYVNGGHWSGGVKGDYIGAEVTGNFGEDFNAGVGYHYFKNHGNKDGVIAAGVGYKLNEDFKLSAAVAHNTERKGSHKTGYNFEGDYKGANRNEKASWGAYVAYRYVPSNAGLAPTYDTFGENANKKGFEFGADWTPYKNTYTKLAYFHGKTFGKANDRTLFARASIFF